MITEIERQEIINAAAEKALLMLPEVVGNLMASNAALSKLNKEFYKDHPEFKNHKQTVASVIEMVEGRDPTVDYKDILKAAIPEIKRRISTVGNLDTIKTPDVPKRDYHDSTFENISSHGELL